MSSDARLTQHSALGAQHSQPVSVTQLDDRADREAFLALPRRLRHEQTLGAQRSALSAQHSPWVEPLRLDQRRLLDPSHPFYTGGATAEAAFFLARYPDGRLAGRIAAIDNLLHNQHLHSRTPLAPREGFFGFFDAVDDVAVARALFGAAEEWLRVRGCSVMLGPASPSHNYEYGLLVEGFEVPHRFMLAHNPPYYVELLAACGLKKARDLYAVSIDLHDGSVLESVGRDAQRFEAIWQQRYGSIQVRRLNRRRWSAEVRLGVELINRSLAENWGFSPMTEGELKEAADTLRFVVDPELVLFAEHEGRAVGVALALPDLNQVLRCLRWRFGYLEPLELLVRSRLHRFDAGRVIALGVARDYPMVGIGPLLFVGLFRTFRRRGLRFLDASWILEDNEVLLRSLHRFRGVADRTYRIFRKALT